MGHKQYIKVIDPFTNPQIQDIIPQLCPARGYYDPNGPIPYIPDPALPEITPLDDEIVLFMSTKWDAAINCITTRTGSTGQIKYTIYGENNTEIYTQNVNSGTT